MHSGQVNYEVKLLLVNESDEKEEIVYTANPSTYQVPKVGSRPPYYCNPRYDGSYPII
ncbi:hypothetical protein [Domibacillus tundrae]|uniref:hypothetical protein n=1 Tax=Domibacillus tundrae TaxID=1587527 RepID=UPI000B1F0D3A|nr:hypothetical protein [Domibacillus tundrae]